MKIAERELLEEIEEVRSRYTGHAIMYSDMPKAHNSEHDLSDYMSEVDTLLQRLQSRQKQIIAVYSDIDRAIEQMDSVTEKSLLRYRYLLGYEWEEIADKMGYALRSVYRIHGDALAHLILEGVKE